MGFNIIKYSDAFDRFLNEMINHIGREDCDELLSEVCEILRIGKIDALFYENPAMEKEGVGESILYFERKNADEDRPFIIREITEKGHVSIYRVHPFIGSEPWSDIELKKIDVLAKMLFTFNARERLIRFADFAVHYDNELKVPNMSYFRRRMGEINAKHQLALYGICFFNLKRFSYINKRVGRNMGTVIMSEYVNELQNIVEDDGCVCRVGGDNFILYFRKERLEQVLEYLRGAEIELKDGSGERVLVSASAGINMITTPSGDITEMIEMTHIASQAAKQEIGKSFIFYDEGLRSRKENANRVEGLFCSAIEKEEFLVYYQPKVLLKNYRLAGAEALCRWKHDGKLIPPGQFIPVLEQSNSICKLDFYVLEHVCMDLRRWIDSGQNAVNVSVNLSRRHMGDPKLLEKIISIIDKYEVPHNLIEIELTETTTDIEFNDLKQIVYGLHNVGIHTSVDDFGVGYSSLNLIRQVPWDVIKIDKSFLPETLDPSSTQYIMFSHLLSMIKSMGLKCIVEGVETVDQVKMLKENNCYLAQGFYFDRPLEITDFEKRLSALGKANS